MGWILGCLLLFADTADEQFLSRRLVALVEAYEEQEHRQSPEPIAIRVAVVREIGHLQWQGHARESAARFLAGVVAADRSYPARAEALRAIGRVGTPVALDAAYRSVFGRAGRSPRYDLLHSIMPRSFASLSRRKDWLWVRDQVLRPGLARNPTGLHHLATRRADEMLAVTIEAAGRAGRTELADEIRPFASHREPGVRASALRALGRLRHSPDLVSAGLRDPDEWVRMAAARSESLPWAQLQRALVDPSIPVRRSALRNVGTRSKALALPQLIVQLRGEPDVRGRLDAHALLVRRTGQDFGLDPQLWGSWQSARRQARAGPTTRAEKQFQATRVLFVVDVSASMGRIAVDGRTRQQQAVEAMRRLIGSTPRSARYAVIGFASEVRRFPERLVVAKSPADVLLWLGSLKPAGASNSYAALMRGLVDPIRPDSIIFISDGVPRHCSWRGRTYSEPEQILHEVRRGNRKSMVRIHTIGLVGGVPRGDARVDEERATAFLRRLAAQNEGTYTEIR